MNFPPNPIFIVSHKSGCAVQWFSLNSRKTLMSFFLSSSHLRGSCLSYKSVEAFSCSCCLLHSTWIHRSLIRCRELFPFTVYVFLFCDCHVVNFGERFHEVLRRWYTLFYLDEKSCRYVRSIWLLTPISAIISLFGFCLGDLSVCESGVLKSSTINVWGSWCVT